MIRAELMVVIAKPDISNSFAEGNNITIYNLQTHRLLLMVQIKALSKENTNYH